jgi:hypothetical protein
MTQTSSQFKSTVPPGCNIQPRMQETPVPETPTRSPPLDPYRYQRVIPSQVPSPRVAPSMSPSDLASPRVTTTLPLADVIPLNIHPESENAIYVPQGMAGMSLFDTFEEEHMDTPSLPR